MRKYNFRSLCILDTLLWVTEGRLVCWCVCVDNLSRGPTKTARTHDFVCLFFSYSKFLSLRFFLFHLTFFVSAIYSLCSFFFFLKEQTKKVRWNKKKSRETKNTKWQKFGVRQSTAWRTFFVGPLGKLSTRTHQHTKRPSVAHNSVSRIQSDRKLYFLIACSKLTTIINRIVFLAARPYSIACAVLSALLCSLSALLSLSLSVNSTRPRTPTKKPLFLHHDFSLKNYWFHAILQISIKWWILIQFLSNFSK